MNADKYPVFRALGATHEFLDEPAAAAASRDERIKSIWPFLVRRSKQFYRSLAPRERVNYDPEDTLTELWVALAARDHLWEPDRGRYITFAGTIIDRELCDLRDRSRTVESPRNSSGRMKEYLSEEAAGTISPSRHRTMNDIRRTGAGVGTIGGEDGDYGLSADDDDPLDILAGGERTSARLAAIKLAIRRLDPFEATVIGRLTGLWGRPRQTVFWVAWETGRDPAEVRRARSDAVRKIRDFLVSIAHPVTQPED